MEPDGNGTALDYSTLLRLVDSVYDEICIYDNNYRMVYVNQACRRHYGYSPQEMMGKSLFDFTGEQWWNVSVLPQVYRDKKPYAIRQSTRLGAELYTIAIPVFGEDREIQYVVMSVRDQVSENILLASRQTAPCEERPAAPILCESPGMRRVMELAERVSRVDATCVLVGESGTGKTMLAKHIHDISPRSGGPFVSVNCASLPPELIESELFGYVKGAFTGAKGEGRKGLFEAADGGTILLDEISEMPYSAQAKLLHVLQDKEFLPVGAVRPVRVDVKIIAATNRDLGKLTESGEFRSDLYYRLNVLEILMPPLRQRRQDIPVFVYRTLNEFGKKYGRSHTISQEALDILTGCEWRGNIRELRHVMERLTVTVDDMEITPAHLPKYLFEVGAGASEAPPLPLGSGGLDSRLEQLERAMVAAAYQKRRTTRGVAKELEISQTRASKLIRKHGLAAEAARPTKADGRAGPFPG